MSIRRWLIAMAACAALAGCEEEPVEPVEPEIAEAPPPSEEEVPVPEDFADEAEQEINAENYQDELARIEAEVGVE